MKCTVCKNGSCKKGITSKMIDVKGSLVVFRGVPAHICDNCGARFFDEKTTIMLVKKARESTKKGMELELINIKAA